MIHIDCGCTSYGFLKLDRKMYSFLIRRRCDVTMTSIALVTATIVTASLESVTIHPLCVAARHVSSEIFVTSQSSHYSFRSLWRVGIPLLGTGTLSRGTLHTFLVDIKFINLARYLHQFDLTKGIVSE